MSKKSKFKQQSFSKKSAQNPASEKSPVSEAADTISKRGKKTILTGIAIVIVGFIILASADPEGKNLPSLISPFIIISGYITIGIGIILPDKNKTSSSENLATHTTPSTAAIGNPHREMNSN